MDKPTLPANVQPVTWIGPEDESLADLGLIHLAHIPPEASTAAPAPLVVMVHGFAGDETSMWIFRQTVPPGVAIVAPRAPIPLDAGGFVWFRYDRKRLQPQVESLDAAQQKLAHFLARLPAHYPVDPTQLVLMGFSQGAMMVNQFIINHPDEALGVASLAGAVPLPPQNPQSHQLGGVPVFVAHGLRDDVIPVKQGRLTHRIFSALGADVTYGEYPAAHKLHTDGIKALKQWLARFFPSNGRG
ncbi:MAG: alpha/beta fold hydrolase [Anaerolineae bacterium]